MNEFKIVICVMAILLIFAFVFACKNGSEDRFIYNLHGKYHYGKEEADEIFYDVPDELERCH